VGKDRAEKSSITPEVFVRVIFGRGRQIGGGFLAKFEKKKGEEKHDKMGAAGNVRYEES